MNQPSNSDRIAWATIALRAYADAKAPPGGNDLEHCDLIDLIADLLHLAADSLLDPADCLRIAQMHYDAETQQENQP